MSSSEPEAERGHTAPIDLSPTQAEPTPATAEVAATPEPAKPAAMVETPPLARAVPADAQTRDVLYVPLAVSVGDGFKFGCGFFLALVLAMLVGFVLLAALFALSSVLGLNLPLGR